MQSRNRVVSAVRNESLDNGCELRNYRHVMDTRLVKLLKTKGLRLVDLARKCKVDKGTATRWSQNGVPLTRVNGVARATGIPRESLRPDFFRERA